ncbi:MAG: DUF2244 domain-containing protein [Rhodomicrobiaceae bacterium]
MSDIQNSNMTSTSDFSAVLLPHRSLGRKGFITLMTIVSALSFFTGVIFFVHGAWPVIAFLCLDVLLIYVAFRLNYRAARIYETVDLSDGELRVTRVYPSGRADSWSFNPYWARLELEEYESGGNKLIVRSHGRALRFGNFLSDDEKRSFAHALRQALQDMRGVRI